MSTRPSTVLHLSSADETAALARAIAPQLRAGDTVLLQGGIGAGKTHFARALIQERLAAANRVEDVPSPTYTIVQTYDDGLTEIWHADLYRLTGSAEIAELGLTDAFADAICLVEWPDRLGAETPKGALWLTLSQGAAEDDRVLTVTAEADRWLDIFPDLLLREGAE